MADTPLTKIVEARNPCSSNKILFTPKFKEANSNSKNYEEELALLKSKVSDLTEKVKDYKVSALYCKRKYFQVVSKAPEISNSEENIDECEIISSAHEQEMKALSEV